MTAILVYLFVGAVFVFMALAGSLLRRLPTSHAIVYLALGAALGPIGLEVLEPDPLADSAILERLTEVAVIVSLFTTGLKLRVPLRDPLWWLPLRLAFGAMALTVGLVALVGTLGLGLPLGAAVLLGAVLAPTDPVLASDVQIEKPTDRDRLRLSLTGEAGLNDGTAFPFVMLGLGLLGLHEIGEFGWRWVMVDLVWAVLAGLGVGGLLGTLVGHLVLYLRREHREGLGLDEFLALGLIALSYGAALLVHAYGFLAVFAAGVALRRIEQTATKQEQPPSDVFAQAQAGTEDELATHPETAPAYMAQAVLTFNEHLERISTVAVVILVGTLLSTRLIPFGALWFVPLLFLVIRPLAVAVSLARSDTTLLQRLLIGWFGIRGIGSIYYLMFAIQHGVPRPVAVALIALTLTTVAVSVVLHGSSVTPLMKRYQRAHALEE